MDFHRVGVAAGVAIAMVCSTSLAQVAGSSPIPLRPAYEYPSEPTQRDEANIRLGDSPFYLTPLVGAGFGYDDNVAFSPNNEISSPFYVVNGGLKLDARLPSHVVRASYQGQVGRYTSSSEDNYVDQTASGSLDSAFGSRFFTRVAVDHVLGHDPRGSTDRGISDQPDRYRLSGPSATVAFGAPSAAGRIEAYASDYRRHYLNNRDVTEASDRETREFGGTFYWRVMPKTRLLVDARRTELDYDMPGSPLNSTERRLFAGVSWEATALTTGTIKVGQLQKRFESDFPDWSSTAWEALVTWAPRTYSKLDLYTARFPTESTGLGRFIVSDAAGAVWTHVWASYLNTSVALRYQKDKYQGFDRKDDIKSVAFKVGYRFRRWLTLGAEYAYSDRSSNTPSFEFTKNFVLLTATASM